MQTHRFDPLSFILGALVVALAVAGLAGPGALAGLDLRWALPAVLVVLGLVMVATTVRRASDEADARAAGHLGAPDDGTRGTPVPDVEPAGDHDAEAADAR
jgi:hypothetical protein